MKTKAHDLHTVMRGLVASAGPGVIQLSLTLLPSHDSIRLGVASDADVDLLAEDLGLDAPTREHAGSVSFRRASAVEGRLTVTVAGPFEVAAPIGPRGAR